MTKPTDLIVVDADGEIITAANGKISSDNPELVKMVKDAFLPLQLISPHGVKVQPSLNPENLLGLTAALFSARPGRTLLLTAPTEVLEWFKDEQRKNDGGCVHHRSRENTRRQDPLTLKIQNALKKQDKIVNKEEGLEE